MKGRPPKPTGMHLVDGTYRPDRDPRGRTAQEARESSAPTGRPPRPPAWLEGVTAKALWRKVARILHDRGVLRPGQEHLLAMYCQSYSIWRAAERAVRADGPILLTAKGYQYQHPGLGIMAQQARVMRPVFEQFGITPAFWDRVGGKGGEPDQFEEFLRGAKR